MVACMVTRRMLSSVSLYLTELTTFPGKPSSPSSDRRLQLISIIVTGAFLILQSPPEDDRLVLDGGSPVLLVPAGDAAMQSVAVVVDSQVVEDSVQGEMSRTDPVGHPAHGGSEVRVVSRLVVSDIIKP